MSDTYGLKATVTMVINDDKYSLGATYTDTEGNNLDKQLSGSLDNIENDITMAILEAYCDFTKQKKEVSKKVETQPDKIESSQSTIEHHFAELERENQTLNDKVDAMFKGRTSTPIQEKKEEVDVEKPTTVKINLDALGRAKSLGMYNNELELLRRLANLKLL